MSFVSDIMDGVIVVGPDSTITLMNSVAEHLLCVKSFMALGKKLSALEGQEELIKALLDFQQRTRRFGGIEGQD